MADPVRYRAWLPRSDARVRCPVGHVWQPHTQAQRGSVAVRCAKCGARLMIVLPRTGGLKLIAEISAADDAALAGCSDGEAELVYLLTTGLQPARTSA